MSIITNIATTATSFFSTAQAFAVANAALIGLFLSTLGLLYVSYMILFGQTEDGSDSSAVKEVEKVEKGSNVLEADVDPKVAKEQDPVADPLKVEPVVDPVGAVDLRAAVAVDGGEPATPAKDPLFLPHSSPFKGVAVDQEEVAGADQEKFAGLAN